MTTPTARRSVTRHRRSEPSLRAPGPGMSGSPHRAPRGLGRALVIGSLLFVFYFLVSLALSPDGYLSTDVGGKTASLAAMSERNDWSTDMGYWAEGSDPVGDVFPYAHTRNTEAGWWVNTTSIPMVLAARPLWELGGAQLILVLPMLSAAAAAVVAGRIQSRLDGSDGMIATVVVGLATPLTIYALDFWEHAPGLMLMGLGSLASIKAAQGLGTRHGIAAGLWFALAATMRQEALVYGFGAGLVLAAVLVSTSRSQGHLSGVAGRLRSLVPAVAMATSAIATLVVSVLVETAYYGSAFRSGRSTQAATAAAGLDGIDDRLVAAFTTALSPINGVGPVVYLLGTMLALGLVWLAVVADGGGDIQLPAVGVSVIGVLLAIRFVVFGPAFVPGLVPTTSLAVVGAVFGLRRSHLRLGAAFALVPLPFVFATQYVAGAVPQWGGRYLLLTGYLLTIVGCAALAANHRPLLRGLVAAGLVVTAGGIWFASVRTNAVADDIAHLELVAGDDVVVWYDPVIAREAGPAIVEHRWLTTWGDARTETTLEVLDLESVDSFVYVDRANRDEPVFDGFERTSELGEWRLDFFEQRLTRYERLGA